MITKLTPAAWALLGVLRRASVGGPPAPVLGFEAEYAELRANNFVDASDPSRPVISAAGEAAFREQFLSN